MLALVDDARAEGLDVTFDTYPSEWASTRLLIMIPPWAQAGGPGPTLERLADEWAELVAQLEGTSEFALNADDPLIADLGRDKDLRDQARDDQCLDRRRYPVLACGVAKSLGAGDADCDRHPRWDWPDLHDLQLSL